MRFRIEYIPDGEDAQKQEEIVVYCRSFDENVKRYCEAIEKLLDDTPAIVYYKGEQEFYLPSSEILFFETDDDAVFAHTAKDVFKVTQRLYQLEEILPPSFMRISKSTVANTSKILSLNRTLPSSVAVQFFNTHKQVYVSKFYYKELKQKLSQRRR